QEIEIVVDAIAVAIIRACGIRADDDDTRGEYDAEAMHAIAAFYGRLAGSSQPSGEALCDETASVSGVQTDDRLRDEAIRRAPLPAGADVEIPPGSLEIDDAEQSSHGLGAEIVDGSECAVALGAHRQPVAELPRHLRSRLELRMSRELPREIRG